MKPPRKYEILLDPAAKRDLSRVQGRDRARIFSRIRQLADSPRPTGAAKLKATSAYRIRIGVWRVIYLVDDSTERVIIGRVKRRNEQTYSRH